MDNAEIIDGALLRLNMLFKLGSVFPKKWKNLEKAVITSQISSAAFLIHHTNNKLGKKKPG